MDMKPKDICTPPPDPGDHRGWQNVVAEKQYLDYDAPTLFRALQGLGAKANAQVRNALAKRLSDLVIKILRRKVSNNHPNEGWDIIYRAQGYVFKAAGLPNSSDGIGFREAFYSRLDFRLLTAIKKEHKLLRTEEGFIAEKLDRRTRQYIAENGKVKDGVLEKELVESDLTLDEHDCDKMESSLEPDVKHYAEATPVETRQVEYLFNEINDFIEDLDVDRLLKTHIPDVRKRMVFRLFMDDVPYKTKRKNTTHSIADAMGIDESTARAWIKEVKEKLHEILRRS